MKIAYVFLVQTHLEKVRLFCSKIKKKQTQFFFCAQQADTYQLNEHWVVPKMPTHSDRWILGAAYELAQYFLKSGLKFDRIVFVNNPELAFYVARLFDQGFLEWKPELRLLRESSLIVEVLPSVFNFNELIVADTIALTQRYLKEIKLKEVIDSLNFSWLYRLRESIRKIVSFRVISAPRYAPSLAVCIPTYNRPNELKESVLSVLKQSILPQEILICDDGSTDPKVEKTINELKSLSPLIQSFYQPNRYVGAARNALADQAKSDYLIYLDDDNLAHPWMIETYRIALSVKENSKAQNEVKDILVSPIDLFEVQEEQYLETGRGYFLGNSKLAGKLVNVMGDAGICVRRKVAQFLRYQENREVGFEDWEFLLWAQANQIKIDTLPVSVYAYRTGKQGSMRQVTSLTQNIRNAFSRVSKLESNMTPGLGVEAALLFQKYYSHHAGKNLGIAHDHVN